MRHSSGIRQAQKEQSRRALLAAALRLLDRQNLSSLGLRELTREVGMAPAAFYRHFHDVEELGVALVDEAFGSLHAMLHSIREGQSDPNTVIDRSIDVIAQYVREHRAHFTFIARERHGGVEAVRVAIAERLRLFADELAGDLAAQPESDGWSAEDVRMLADLYVDHMVLTALGFLEAESPDAERAIAETARRQLRLISLGRRHWPID